MVDYHRLRCQAALDIWEDETKGDVEYGDEGPCTWLLKDGYTEDGDPRVRECEARVTRDERGWHCEAGHGYTVTAVRRAEGWDYAEGDDEAGNMAKYGIRPMPIAYGG